MTVRLAIDDIIEELVGGPLIIGDAVTAAELGELLGLSTARVHAIAREGRIPRRADGSFDLKHAVRTYVESLRTKTGASALAQNPELNLEKIRIARASAEKIETANARARGDLAPLSEVERTWAGILRDVRAAFLALPSRAASRLGHLTPHDVAVLDREVRAVLEELVSE
jgi:phage terminase Nu1 subunit (DNA packaging protein)